MSDTFRVFGIIATIVFTVWFSCVLAWLITIGHWENHLYRFYAFAWTIAMVLAIAAMIFINWKGL